jgi:hypothetical protein
MSHDCYSVAFPLVLELFLSHLHSGGFLDMMLRLQARIMQNSSQLVQQECA